MKPAVAPAAARACPVRSSRGDSARDIDQRNTSASTSPRATTASSKPARRDRSSTRTTPGAGPGACASALQRYQVLRIATAARSSRAFASYSLSADDKKLLYQAGGGANRAGASSADRQARRGRRWRAQRRPAGNVGGSARRVGTDFAETWRIQRDYFYDAKMHGADWQAVWAKYARSSRPSAIATDLATSLPDGRRAHGWTLVPHGPGDMPGEEPVSVGLFGADFAIENGHYRIKRVFTGENWNPELRAPLSAPGIRVAEGDYLLEVNGRPLTPPTNIYRRSRAPRTIRRDSSQQARPRRKGRDW